MEQNGFMKQLVEMAVAAGRKRQSAQTGFVHFCYNLHQEEAHLPIPLLENALFVLALMRTRTSENILEGKDLLDKILYFQNKEREFADGNFPIYIHEYPICKDRWLGTRLALPFLWIYKNFHQILGAELKSRLEKTLLNILQHSLKSHAEKPAPFSIAVKIGAAATAAGKLFGVVDLQTQGESLLDSLQSEPIAAHSPSTLGSVQAALQLVYPQLKGTPWEHFWKYLVQTWHLPTGSYIGPLSDIAQAGEDPETTLYDLYLSVYSGNISSRILKDHICHLEAALIHSNMDEYVPVDYPFTVAETKWQLMQNEHVAYSVNEGTDPFRIVWGNQKKMHSLVCQRANIKEMKYQVSPEGLELIFWLGESVNFEDREKSREIAFYLDYHEEADIKVGETKATTFQLEDLVKLDSGHLSLAMKYEVLEGEGKFLGHVMIGNRPSQISAKGVNRFSAYDWQIFLRTLHRSNDCCVKVTLSCLPY